MATSLSPGIEQFEKNISFNAVSAGGSNIGSVITSDYGYAFEPYKLTSEAEIIQYFGTPTKYNASDWFQPRNVLDYVGSVNIVRAIDQAKATKNLGISFWLDDSVGDTLTTSIAKQSGLYNQEIMTLTMETIGMSSGVNGNTEVLKVLNRYVTSNQDIGIAIASDTATWSSNVSSDIPVVFSSYFDFVPDFANNEFAILIFQKNIDNTFSFLEKWIANYDETGKDVYGKSNFAETLINAGSSYIYIKVNENAIHRNVNTDASTILDMIKTMDTSGIPVWEATTAYSLDDLIKFNGFIYKCTTAGTSDADQSAWDILTQAVGNTETDGTVEWTIEYDTGDYIYPNKLVNHIFVYDGFGFTQGDIDEAFVSYEDPEEIYVNILIPHPTSINKSAELVNSRKDGISVMGPYDYTQLVGKSRSEATAYLTDNFGTVDANSPLFTSNSTYVVVYGNIGYQYDKYNDKNRWVPLYGDLAGMIALSEEENESWTAAAGIVRGKLKNKIKLAFQPNKSNRDDLYKNSINPVIAITGEGSAIVYGHKTSTSIASAFDRLNVRRLLLELEKTTSDTLKPFVFEFNDTATRDRILATLNPFYESVLARRGVYDFLIVCDETNNTSEIIDTNQLVVDIYVKPVKTADFIQVNQIVTKTGVEFSEIVA